MKEYAVLGETKLGEWVVLKVCEDEETAKDTVKTAWRTTDGYGYCLFHAVRIFEREAL